jgi:dihydrofolate reductase
MSKLIHSSLESLDGYIEDERGTFNWAAPDADVHSFVNDLIRPIGTYFYGRRMYETMLAWETLTEGEPVLRDFGRNRRAAQKVVFSNTLRSPSSARTRIENEFRPDLIRSLLATSPGGALIGGAELASAAFAAPLVDEHHLLIVPYVAGGGKKALPERMPLRLELLDEKRLARGTVYLRYRVDY